MALVGGGSVAVVAAPKLMPIGCALVWKFLGIGRSRKTYVLRLIDRISARTERGDDDGGGVMKKTVEEP
jgi:hypothetical protein